jgi:hypothetical protein
MHTSAMSPTRTSRCCSKYALLLTPLLFEPLAVLRVSIAEKQRLLWFKYLGSFFSASDGGLGLE